MKRLTCFALLLLICLSIPAFAQDEENPFHVDDEEETQEQEGEGKQAIFYKVLGREQTPRERELYKNLNEKDIKDQVLIREQRLVIVRALLAIGEPQAVNKVLELWDTSKLQTFTELFQIFQNYKEKYGSVREAVQSELVFNIKDNEQAFMKAARKAYETVFCVTPQDGDTAQIVNYFKQNEALTFSQMVKKLLDSLTQNDKKEMLFKTLDKVGRADLKENASFTEKILSQEFTCENLTALLKELPAAQKKAPKAQPKSSKPQQGTKKPKGKK